jgi:hypothetical protein
VALRAMNQSRDERSLACLIERSAELKRALVGFALSPRMERHLERFMQEGAGPDEVLIEDEAIDAIDRFALLYRLPNGKTVLDQFLSGRPGLSAADREMLRGWRDPVDGIFEIRGKDRDSLILLNLIDDLEYRAYSNMGPAAFRPLPKHGFVYARLVPIGSACDAWLVSGSMRAYRKSDAAQVAEVALELATRLPELAHRNPGKSSKHGSRCGRSGPRSWSSSAVMNWSFRPPMPRNGSTPLIGIGRKPRSPHGPLVVGRQTSRAWTCPHSSFRPNSSTP